MPEKKVEEKKGTIKKQEEDNDELYEIEYHVVNMPGLIQQSPTRFMALIQEYSDRDITFLEIPVIQMVINFKWTRYTEGYFLAQFYKTILFLLSFVLDIIIQTPEEVIVDGLTYFIITVVSRAICALVMLDHAFYETRQVFKIYSKVHSLSKTISTYFFKDFWNFFDLTIFLLYLAYLPISYFYEPEDYLMKAIQCAIIFQFSVKFNFYLRLYDKFGFLVQMIVNVFYDLRYFLLYFAMLISFFSIMISIIMRGVEQHEGIAQFMFFIMTLRTSLGDNDID